MEATRWLVKGKIFIRFVIFYFYELTVSSFWIAWEVITPKDYRKPGFIELPLKAKTDMEIALISNLITFSPGSMVVGLSDDRKYLRIHLVFLEDSDSAIENIKKNLESRVLELLR